jgi:hypothetical protein
VRSGQNFDSMTLLFSAAPFSGMQLERAGLCCQNFIQTPWLIINSTL